MNKMIKKVSRTIQIVLLAPIKLPAKAMQVLKYIAVGLGIIETVLEKEEDKPVEAAGKEGRNADDE